MRDVDELWVEPQRGHSDKREVMINDLERQAEGASTGGEETREGGLRAGDRAKCVVWTLNNYTAHELGALCNSGPPVTYICWGKEVGSEGTAHLQGYLELNATYSYSRLHLIPGLERAWFGRRRGSQAQAIAYTKKDGDWTEYGLCKAQGKRTDLAELKEMVDEGKKELEIAEADFEGWCRSYKALERYRYLKHQGPRTPPRVVLFWGLTGSGKTKRAYAMGDDCWVWGGDKWFDGYEGQKVAVLDDFDGSQIAYRFLLRVLDRYRLQVPVKFGFTWWRPETIVITSNREAKSWYPNEDPAPLLRRIHEIRYLHVDGEDIEKCE